MLIAVNLADAIRGEMIFPSPNSAQLIGWGTGIIQEMIAHGLIANASVTGICPPSGGPLANGAATAGVISGLQGPSLANRVAPLAGYGSVDVILTTYCTQIATHIMTLGKVSFAAGNITGVCTNTPISPGVLTGGAGTGGIITGLSGQILANLIASAMAYPFVSTQLFGFCDAICNYLQGHASASYSSGAITGVCPPGGGSLAGVGTLGTFT